MKPAAWIVVGVLGAGTVFNVALALGAGSQSVRNGADPPGSAVVTIAVLIAVVAACVISALAIARPTRIVAAFAPMFWLYLFAAVFTYDNYDAPSLQRYWDAQGAPAGEAVSLAIALLVGGVAYRWPRAGAALTLVGLPVLFVASVIAGGGH